MKNTNDAYLDNNNKNENVEDYIRAVFEAYKRKYVNNLKTEFETVILDRIVKWKEQQKAKKTSLFLFSFFISFFLIFLLIYINFFTSIEKFYYIAVSGLLIGLFLSLIDSLYLRGQTPIRSFEELIGFKKAIWDLNFETFRSTQIRYYIFIFIYLFLLFLVSLYSTSFTGVDEILFNIFNKIVDKPIYLPSFEYIIKYVLYFNLLLVLGDFFFIILNFHLTAKKHFI